jgi:hypothetical protein
VTKRREHRLGVDEVNLVKRNLRVIEPDSETISLAVKEIDEIYGLDAVSFDRVHHVLYVAYDATRICLDCVEEVLEKNRIEIDSGWWMHFKEEYYRFVDENIKDNANHEPFSCHKVPPHK